jgi:hypothetical protein
MGIGFLEKEVRIIETLSCGTYAGYLTRSFPEYRLTIEAEVGIARPGTGDWTLANALTRNVLIGEVLDHAVAAADDAVLRRCYGAVEELLVCGDEELRDAMLHEVPRAALHTAAHAERSQMRAGPLLAAAIGEYVGNVTWRTRSDWDDESGDDVRVVASLEVYQFRGELLMHGRRYSADENNYPITAPFGRIRDNTHPAQAGAVISELLSEVATATAEVRAQSDEFLEFAGVDWRTLYTESRSAGIEIISGYGDVCIWPHEGEQRGDSFVSRPVKSAVASNWHEQDGLWTAVLAALHRSSTTGFAEN